MTTRKQNQHPPGAHFLMIPQPYHTRIAFLLCLAPAALQISVAHAQGPTIARSQASSTYKTAVTVAVAPARSTIRQPIVRRLKGQTERAHDLVILPSRGVSAEQLANVLRAYSASRQTDVGDETRDAMIRSRPASADSMHLSTAMRLHFSRLFQRLQSSPQRYITGLGMVHAVDIAVNLPRSRAGHSRQ
jgi:hypothetical protein